MKLKFTFSLAAGILSFSFGVIFLGMWIYLMNRVGHTRFWVQPFPIKLHIFTVLIAAIGLISAGITLFLKKKEAIKYFFIADGFLFITMIYAAFQYLSNPQLQLSMIHPYFTFQLSIASVAILTYGLGLVYIWEHFIFNMEKIRTKNPFKYHNKRRTQKMA